MKRYEMVKSHEDFNNIIKNGKKISNKYFTIFSINSENYNPKFGIAVGKKLGNAVNRNKIKRQMRNILDNHKILFKNFHNYIIIINRGNLSFKELDKGLITLLERK